MKERPFLFSGQMVRAILDGSKTQTRRICKLQPHEGYGMVWWPDGKGTDTGTGGGAPGCYLDLCPYGQRGDRLWVRETHAFVSCDRDDAGAFFGPEREIYDLAYERDYDDQWFRVAYAAEIREITWEPPHFRPSIHMPRWASRILLEVVSVRVERLQEISEADARSEGIERAADGYWFNYSPDGPTLNVRESYRTLWESIHGKGSWDANPWVWVVEFKRVEVA